MKLARCRVPLAVVCLLLGDGSAVAADVPVATSMALLRSRRQR